MDTPHSPFAVGKTMETFHPDMSTYVKSCTRTRARKSKWCRVISWSGVLIVVVSRRGQLFSGSVSVLLGRRGQSFFLLVVVSRRGQLFFVDGVYVLWWLCTRIYRGIWLGKTAVSVWTNVRAVGRTRVGGHETRLKPKPNVDYYLVTYYYYYYFYYYY